MKKLLITSAIIALASNMAFAGNDFAPPQDGPKGCPDEMNCPSLPPHRKMTKTQKEQRKMQMEKKRAEFDKRLNLTEEQKAKIKASKENGHKEMKPIMEQLKVKREAARKYFENNDTQNCEFLKLEKEIKALEEKRRELHKKNMEEFESILTDKQKKELEKMKQERKKEFQKRHRNKIKGCPVKK